MATASTGGDRKSLTEYKKFYGASNAELTASLKASEMKLLEVKHLVSELALNKDTVDDLSTKSHQVEKSLKAFEEHVLHLKNRVSK